jgi:hypothetical protein
MNFDSAIPAASPCVDPWSISSARKNHGSEAGCERRSHRPYIGACGRRMRLPHLGSILDHHRHGAVNVKNVAQMSRLV